MKVKIDENMCSGHGRCGAYASDVYELDDNGYNEKIGQTFEVPEYLEKRARIGAMSCPEQAITSIDD